MTGEFIQGKKKIRLIVHKIQKPIFFFFQVLGKELATATRLALFRNNRKIDHGVLVKTLFEGKKKKNSRGAGRFNPNI